MSKISQLQEKLQPQPQDQLLIIDSQSNTPKKIQLNKLFNNPLPISIQQPLITSNLKILNNYYEGGILSIDTSGNLIYKSYYYRHNDIGVPGEYGFGCGICPEFDLPSDIIRCSDYNYKISENYGNYIHTPSSSVIVWIPKFYYRINHESNPTHSQYAPNDIDIKSIYDFEDTASANAEGYALHRAFIDGGVEQPGFFIDKYSCSKVAYGTGYIGASIKNGVPIGFDEAFSCITELTASNSVRQAYIVIDCAKARDGVDGQVNPTSNWHCASTFQYSALALLSLAHGQASTNTLKCAWYDPVYNYPKGNNNALTDIDDPTVTFTSDGYLTVNTALTGSGEPFAKTTHNGQECGVADLAANIYELSIGFTGIYDSLNYNKSIISIILSNPTIIEIDSTSGLENFNYLFIDGTTIELNQKYYLFEIVNETQLSIDIDSTSFTPYTSGGYIFVNDYYVAKESTSMKTFTSGNTLATDHWGSTGNNLLMNRINIPYVTDYEYNNALVIEYVGNLNNQVFYTYNLLTDILFPLSFSNVGTNLFGKDRIRILGPSLNIENDLFYVMLCGGDSESINSSGINSRDLNYFNSSSSNNIGFRVSRYIK